MEPSANEAIFGGRNMSILIEGMEMPKGCASCPFFDDECFGAYKCDAVQSWGSDTERASGCPLIPIPPHGRLIDADALHKLFEDQWHYLQVLDWNENPTAEANQSGINWCINTMHDDAPTVIPASEEG